MARDFFAKAKQELEYKGLKNNFIVDDLGWEKQKDGFRCGLYCITEMGYFKKEK